MDIDEIDLTSDTEYEEPVLVQKSRPHDDLSIQHETSLDRKRSVSEETQNVKMEPSPKTKKIKIEDSQIAESQPSTIIKSEACATGNADASPSGERSETIVNYGVNPVASTSRIKSEADNSATDSPIPVIKLELEIEESIFKIPEKNTLCIYVDKKATIVSATLLSGTADIFGAVMEKSLEYLFPADYSFSILSHTGCDIKLNGNFKSRLEKQPYYMLDTKIHAFLQEQRLLAEHMDKKGPVILIAGPSNAGKRTFCRFLSNYAARMEKEPYYVDLDVANNNTAIPGTVAIVQVKKPAEIVEGFRNHPMEVFHFGHKTPEHNLPLYHMLMIKMSIVIRVGLTIASKNAKSSGVIINTGGWVRGEGYRILTETARIFNVGFVTIFGDKNLYNHMKMDLPQSVQIRCYFKQPFAITRTRDDRMVIRDANVRAYFFGVLSNFNPFTLTLQYSSICVYEVKYRDNYGHLMNPARINFDNIFLKPVPLGNHLLNRVLSICTSNDTSVEIALLRVAGFVYVTSVIPDQGLITVVSPQLSPLPGEVFFMGDIRMYHGR